MLAKFEDSIVKLNRLLKKPIPRIADVILKFVIK